MARDVALLIMFLEALNKYPPQSPLVTTISSKQTFPPLLPLPPLQQLDSNHAV